MATTPVGPKRMSDIVAKILNPAMTSQYEVQIPTKPSISNFLKERRDAGLGVSGDIYDLLTFSCSEASLPGASFATHDVDNDYTGVTERIAYRMLYDSRADFTFYVDSDYNIIKFFETWRSYIANEQFAQGLESNTFNYRVNFPTDYRNDIYIVKFERNTGSKINEKKSIPLVYTFKDAYPLSISSMPVSYDSSQLLKCTVSFTYTRYFIGSGKTDLPNISENESQPFNLDEKVDTLNNPLSGPGFSDKNLEDAYRRLYNQG